MEKEVEKDTVKKNDHQHAKKENKKNENVQNKNNEECEKLKLALQEERDKALRIQAEMMNFKRRKEDEVISIKKYANEDILKKLINIVDNFERAFVLETEENQE